jgi:hypothetical protein
MRSVRPEGAASSRLRAFIEEFPSPAGVAAYANLPTPLGVARGDMCNRISFVPTGQAAQLGAGPEFGAPVAEAAGAFDVQIRMSCSPSL